MSTTYYLKWDYVRFHKECQYSVANSCKFKFSNKITEHSAHST